VTLALFGAVFAVNSSVHSYLILAYSDGDKVAINVGFCCMANAGGRLIGTLLAGLLFQVGGVLGCLWASAAFRRDSRENLAVPAARRTRKARCE